MRACMDHFEKMDCDAAVSFCNGNMLKSYLVQ